MNSLWRHLKLTNPLESAIPLGILQSNACSGQNKGITVTKQETAQKLFSTRKEWKPFRAEHPGTSWEALHSMDKTPFLSYSSSRERIPTAHRSSCHKTTPTFCAGQSVSSSKTIRGTKTLWKRKIVERWGWESWKCLPGLGWVKKLAAWRGIWRQVQSLGRGQGEEPGLKENEVS